jgi:hypothetical protein
MDPTVGEGRMSGAEPVNAGARVARLWDHLVALLRLRLRQAQGDASSAARRLMMGAIVALVALVLFLLTLPLLVTAVILALATVMPGWLAALVVLVLLLAVVAGLLVMARARLRWRGVSLLEDLRADWEAVRRKVREER